MKVIIVINIIKRAIPNNNVNDENVNVHSSVVFGIFQYYN